MCDVSDSYSGAYEQHCYLEFDAVYYVKTLMKFLQQ